MTKLEQLAVRLHKARAKVSSIKSDMAAFRCQYEQAAIFLSELRDRNGFPYEAHDTLQDPCWKGTYEDCGDSYGRKEYVAFGDDRDGGWCGPCKAREKLREPLSEVKLRMAGLAGAFWRAVKLLAQNAG